MTTNTATDPFGAMANAQPVAQPNAPTEIESPGRVLVVDDTPANLRLLTGILKVEGFEIVTAGSGAEALGKIHQVMPDVVLLDVMMPVMDGFEVCRRIVSDPATAQVPVVMVTALQDTADRVRAIEAGAADFLTKPVEEIEVAARVRSLVQARRNRAALEKAYLELQRAEAMRDNLAVMIVHDLRTPLTTLMVSLDLLQSNSAEALEDWQKEVIDMSARSGKYLLSLVNQLLDVSKLESGKLQLKLERVVVPSLVQEAIEQVRAHSSEGGPEIEVSVDSGLPELQADSDLLRRVLINLLGNAIKFTRSNRGAIRISARLDTKDPSSILFAVHDKGAGIPPEDHEHIFDKFAQARNNDRSHQVSSGLGLTFCKLVVEAHGGGIGVESQLGEGSTFYFTVPTGS